MGFDLNIAKSGLEHRSIWHNLFSTEPLQTRRRSKDKRAQIKTVQTSAENGVLLWDPIPHSKKLVEKIGFRGPSRCEHGYTNRTHNIYTQTHTPAITLHIILSDKHINCQLNSDTHKTVRERVSHITDFVFLSERKGRKNI